jgi:replicative DNA helicase
MTETLSETVELLFADDPERAAGLDAMRKIWHGADTRPWASTLDALSDFTRTQRAQIAALEPLTPASSLLGSVFDDIQTRYDHRQATGKDAIGHTTGFPRLDTILGGLDRGRLSVLLAPPGAGKTTLSNQLAAHVAATGAPVLYVSFENSTEDLILKQLARIAGKNAQDIRRGRIDPETLKAAHRTFFAGAGQRLFYIDGNSATTIETISAAVEQLQGAYPKTYPLIVIDYLQRLALTATASARGSGLDDMRGRVSGIAQQLRGLANDTDCHIWAISSVARADYKNGDKVGIASGAESSGIEFAADAMLTYAPGPGATLSNTTDPFVLGVVKNRHGESDKSVAIAREKHTMRLTEVDMTITSNYTEQVRAGWKSA